MKVAPKSPTRDELNLLRELAADRARSENAGNKTLEAYYWKGLSPGPLMSWTIAGKETIGLGLWVDIPSATDGVPYFVISGGQLFNTLNNITDSSLNPEKRKIELLNVSHRANKG